MPDTNKQIVVAKIIEHYSPGFLNGYLVERMLFLDDRFRVLLIFLDNPSGMPMSGEYNGLQVYCVSGKPIDGFSPKTVLSLRKILKQEHASVLDCNGHMGTFYGVLAALLLRGRFVLSHVHGLNRCRTWTRKLFYRLFGRKIKGVLACSKAVAQDVAQNYKGIDPDKILTLPNSVNFGRYADVSIDKALCRRQFGIPENAFVFVAAGRLVPTKSFDLLIRAFQSVARTYENAWLLIAGEGRDRPMLEQLRTQTGVEDRIIMPGFRTDLPQLYKMSDCFVLSSCREGMPLVVMEAMAAGLNVIATRAGGVGEILDEGRYGRLVPVGDLDAMIAAMNALLAMPDAERKALAESASQRIRDFSHETMAERLSSIYLQIRTRHPHLQPIMPDRDKGLSGR